MKNLSPSFTTKAGRLTPYALACGYQEKYETHPRQAAGYGLTLWREGGVYHVRAHDYDEHKRLAWKTFETLTPARKYFDVMKSSLKRMV